MTWERYTDELTSFEVQSWIGPRFHIRSFCDDPLGGVYLTKAPTCKLIMTPMVQFANTNIAWDISNSRSSTGTIDVFNIEWGGTTDIGDKTSQDWAVDPKTGNVQYTGLGTYTAEAWVQDTLGNRSPVQQIQIQIVDYVALKRAYIAAIGTTNEGAYILDDSGIVQANTGLTGNHANMRALHLHPLYKYLPVGFHHLWAATQDGLAYTIDGAANWVPIEAATLGTPANDAGDSPAPAAGDLDHIDLCFDPQDPRTVYALFTTTSPKRVWVSSTSDYGATWNNVQVGI